MAEVAIQGGVNVRGVGLGIHAFRRTTVMAGRAIVHNDATVDVDMIVVSASKSDARKTMAHSTIKSSWNVVEVP